MTQHEKRVEEMLREILHLLYMYLGLTADQTTNPRVIRVLSDNGLMLYSRMFREFYEDPSLTEEQKTESENPPVR